MDMLASWGSRCG